MAFVRFSSSLDPIDTLLRLQREFDRVSENPVGFDLGLSGRGVFPPINVFNDQDGYIARLEVPGVAPGDIVIETQGQTLRISGKRESQLPAGASFHRHERGDGQFSRSLQFPTAIELTKAEASCKNGMLTIRIPKKEEAKPRQISVIAA
jgi:HSP20 family protein